MPEQRLLQTGSEREQATLAVYAHEMVKGIKSLKLLDNVVHLASSDVPPEYFTEEDQSGYADFLRQLGENEYGPVAERTALLKEYNNFAPAINNLITEIEGHEGTDPHPSQLGSGSRATAHIFEHNHETYVARLSRSGTNHPVPASQIDARLAGAIRGRGLPHFEQAVAASYEKGIFISKPLAGKSFGKLSPQEQANIPEWQLGDVAASLDAAYKNGILLDFEMASNFLYDSEEGVGFIDYGATQEGAEPSRALIFGAFAELMERASIPDAAITTIEGFRQYKDDSKASLQALENFRRAAAERLSDDEAGDVLSLVDARIANKQKLVAELSDPEWVNEAVRNGGWLSPDTLDIV